MRFGLIPETPEERAALEAGAVPQPLADVPLGMVVSRCVVEAHRTGLVAALSDRPRHLSELAGRLALHPTGLDLLLRVLASLGYAAETPDGWAAGPATTWLRSEDVSRSVDFAGALWGLVGELGHALVSPPPDLHARDLGATFQARYQDALQANAADQPDQLAACLRPDRPPRRVLDAGGGHGAYAAALARRWPGLQATVLDLPAAAGHQPAGIRFVAGDLRTADLGGPYDVVLLLSVLPHLAPDHATAVVYRSAAALAPGGLLVTAGPEEPTGLLGAAGALLFYLMCGRRPYDAPTVAGWMAAAGLEADTAPDLGPSTWVRVGRRPEG